MREVWSSHESWVYECLSCAGTWQEEYDCRHTADGHGGEAAVYEHDGQPCTSPWCDHTCPSCGAQNVKTFPAARVSQAIVPLKDRPNDLELVFKLRRLHAY